MTRKPADDQLRIAIVGFGEAGSTFARAAGWKDRARAFDIDPKRRRAIARAGVFAASSAADAIAEADVILSVVTADQAFIAARDYAPFIKPDVLWCDLNSVAPATKQESCKRIEKAGGCYVDVAVMAPVKPAAMAVPLLVSGPAAGFGRLALGEIGFTNCRVVGSEVGRSSAIKMIRSIMVKGVEALTDEMIAAATAAGVVDEVLASLDASEKALPWTERAAYNLERMATHGERRAAEMEQSTETLRCLGIAPLMTLATAIRQRNAASRNRSGLSTA